MGRAAEGTVRKLPSGRFQARFYDPDGVRRNAPRTFQTKRDAKAWLRQTTVAIERGQWQPTTSGPGSMTVLFRDYAAAWLDNRRVKGRPLSARTRQNYRGLLDRHILPTFGAVPVHRIERDQVERWYDALHRDTPATASHAYSLLRAILATATDDDYLPANPARVRGAGRVESTRHRNEPVTKAELDVILDHMPERYRLLIQLGFYCGLRFGELSELRRSDLDTRNGVIHVRRAVVWIKENGQQARPRVKSTKTDAGERDVSIPPHLVPTVREHLLRHTAPGPDGLLFAAVNDPGVQVHNSTIRRSFVPARAAAGRPDVRLHDLRHASASRAFEAGATVPEVMYRHGWTSLQMVTRYAHATRKRDRWLAEQLSELDGSAGEGKEAR